VSRYQVRPKTPKTWTIDGWTGVYDSRSVKAERDGDAPLLINLIPTDTQRGGGVYLRPGRQPLGALSAAPQIGSGSHNVQWIGEVTFATSGTVVIVIADGEIWKLGLTGTLTKMVSAANLTTAVLEIKTDVACHAVNFDGLLAIVAHDTAATGLHPGYVPFTWDGTTGAGGLTKLDNAPANGVSSMTVYYAKLFMLKRDRKTIVWSEENQPNTGYEAGGYNNAWELTQTSNEPLTAIIGTNEALYYGRANSVGAIRGAVSSTFTTDGVHDSISTGSGPDSDVFFGYAAGTLFWMDFKGNVYGYRGGEVVRLTDQMPRLYGTEGLEWHASNTTTKPVYGAGEEGLGNALAQFLLADPVSQRLYVEFSSTLNGRWVQVYDADSLKLLSLWSYGTSNTRIITGWPNNYRAAAMCRNSNSDSRYITIDGNGYVFQQYVSTTQVIPPTADYTEAGVGTGVTGTLIGSMHGWSTNVEWQFDRIDVLTDALPSNNYTVGYVTSRQHKVALTPTDQSLTDSSQTSTPYERHKAFGINANGRWIRPIITLTGSTSTTQGSQPPQLFGYSVTAYPVSAAPTLT
jgi:hypothetical protein